MYDSDMYYPSSTVSGQNSAIQLEDHIFDETLLRDEILGCLLHAQQHLQEDVRRTDSHPFTSLLLAECQELSIEVLSRHDVSMRALSEVLPRVRQLLKIFPSVVLASEWMSPSTGHALRSERGRYCDYVSPASFDYKRDRHKEAEDYERAYDRELREMNPGLSPRTFVASSGMSAISLLLNFLIAEGRLRGVLAAPSWLYYESLCIFNQTYGKRLALFDASTPEGIVDAVNRGEAEVLFLEGVANSEKFTSCDVIAVLEYLEAECSRNVCVVIDLTATPLFSCESLLERTFAPHIQVVIVESLAKFHQCGLDVVTGGCVTFLNWNADPESFAAFREKFGANHNDAACLALPRPSRMLVERRFVQQCVNAAYLHKALHREARKRRSRVLSEISYLQNPSLRRARTHACAATPLLKLHVQELKGSVSYSELLRRITLSCQKVGVEIREGTSFGFNNSRITVVGPSSTSPFIRLSVGTETKAELEALAKAVLSAVEGNSV